MSKNKLQSIFHAAFVRIKLMMMMMISTNVGSIKKSIWECFANKAYENGKIQFCQTTS